VSYEDLAQSVMEGDIDGIKPKVEAHLAKGAPAGDIIAQGLLPGMNVVGRRFRDGDMFIPEVMRSARAMNDAMLVLEPLIVGESVPSQGRIVIGTVLGDVHNIGKDLVIMLWKSGGFEVIDLGVNVPPAVFVQAIEKERPQILGLSALLTTTMPAMTDVIQAVEAAGLRNGLRIVVGGAPVNREYALQIGADGYAPDAGGALQMAKDLVGELVG